MDIILKEKDSNLTSIITIKIARVKLNHHNIDNRILQCTVKRLVIKYDTDPELKRSKSRNNIKSQVLHLRG
jgi:hypothetical protein